VLENRFELIWSSCKIEKAIAAGSGVFVDFIQAFGQAFVTGLVVELAPMIKNRLSKRLPNLVTNRLPGKLARGLFKIPPEFVIAFVATSESDNRGAGGQITVSGEVIQRGNEFAMGEIARGAEDHNGARLRHWASGKPFPERVWFGLISTSIHFRLQITQISADWITRIISNRGS
jgi:hypothetical protein